MQFFHWMIRESSGCWTPSLRLAVQRNGARAKVMHCFHNLDDTHRIVDSAQRYPNGVYAVEITPECITRMFIELCGLSEQFSGLCLFGLLHPDFHNSSRENVRQLTQALCESGCVDVFDSPRAVKPLFNIVDRQVSRNLDRVAAAEHNQPLAERIWNTLPWQPED